MKVPAHNCDSQAVAGIRVINFMGLMGWTAVVGLLILAWAKREPNPVVLTALAGAIGGAMTGMPALMGRLSNQPHGPTETTIVNKPDEPVPVEETKQ